MCLQFIFSIPQCILHITALPSPSQPWSKRAVDGGVQGCGRECLPGLSPMSLPVTLPAKFCAFLLQLSEGLTKGEMQLCSNILIIYCSAAHITVHHHLERSSGLKRSFHFHYWAQFCSTWYFFHHLTLFLLDSDMLEKRMWRRRKNGRASIWGGGLGHLKCVHLFWVLLSDNILLMLCYLRITR